MSKFNNNEYQSLVVDLMGDMFYNDTSISGKISFVRKYAEVVIRKILDFNQKKEVTLGNDNIRNQMNNLSNHEFLKAALKIFEAKEISRYIHNI